MTNNGYGLRRPQVERTGEPAVHAHSHARSEAAGDTCEASSGPVQNLLASPRAAGLRRAQRVHEVQLEETQWRHADHRRTRRIDEQVRW